MNELIQSLPLIMSVIFLFTFLIVFGVVLSRSEGQRVTCHITGQPFEATETREIGSGFMWVVCELCDAQGHVRGEKGYDRTRPAWHMIDTNKTADATNIDGFKTKENL